jgi:hypothetical protein
MTLLVIIVVLSVFILLGWLLTSVNRVLAYPDPPFEKDLIVLRAEVMAGSLGIPVGAREIREEQRRYRHVHAGAAYQFTAGDPPAGMPEAWLKDLWLRRN